MVTRFHNVQLLVTAGVGRAGLSKCVGVGVGCVCGCIEGKVKNLA